MIEKQILDKLVEITTDQMASIKMELYQLQNFIDRTKFTDSDVEIHDRIMEQRSELTLEGQELNSCLDYLNKRLAEIDLNRPCEHYFPIAWRTKNCKKHYYYKPCEFCGCEPLETLRDLNA